jgi:hypothetical protein
MVAAITAATKVKVYLEFAAMACGGGTTMLGGMYANDPAQGQNGYPIAADNAQSLYKQVAEVPLGFNGSLTLAEIQTALVQVANDIAGATGTPLISAADLATINGWATGNP